MICENLIPNGGFEDGEAGWVVTTDSSDPVINTKRPRTGRLSAWFGGYPDAVDFVRSVAEIPMRPADRRKPGDLISGELLFDLRIETEDPLPFGEDVLVANFVNPDNRETIPIGQATNQDPTDRWFAVNMNVTQLVVRRGAWKRAWLVFIARTDSQFDTSFFVDNVTLTVCRRP